MEQDIESSSSESESSEEYDPDVHGRMDDPESLARTASGRRELETGVRLAAGDGRLGGTHLQRHGGHSGPGVGDAYSRKKKLDPRSFVPFLAAAPEFKALRSLDLSWCAVGDYGVLSIALASPQVLVVLFA